jgi:hypothetical protein
LVVLVVLDVLGHVHLVVTDAAGLVDPLPERLLRVGDRHGQGAERTLGEVRDDAEVDAALVLVDRLGAGLAGHADVGFHPGLVGRGLASPAGGERTRRHEEDEGYGGSQLSHGHLSAFLERNQ